MDELKKRLGKRIYVAPLALGLAVFCVLGLAMAPMLNAAPHDVPLAIVNLDEGATLPSGEELRAGEMVVENIVAASQNETSDKESPLAWSELSDEAELDSALEEGLYYGAIVIPSDFTESQISGQMASADALQTGLAELMAAQATAVSTGAQAAPQAQQAMADSVKKLTTSVLQAQQSAVQPTVTLYLNRAKSPLLSQVIQSQITGNLAQAGIQVNEKYLGLDATGENMIAEMAGVQFMVMPLLILSLMLSIPAVAFSWPRRESSPRPRRAKIALGQVIYSLTASLIAAVVSYGIVAWIGGIHIDAGACILFLWLASFCIMVASMGLCDLSLPAGAVAVVAVFSLGLFTATLPVEMMPSFWANWIAPWAPQYYLGEGLRAIMYQGLGAFDADIAPLLATGAIGIAGMTLAVLLPRRENATSEA